MSERRETYEAGEQVELKPCPFCGSQAEYQIDGQYAWVECTKCIATGKTFMFLPEPNEGAKKEVIKNWNNRPVEAALLARAERAEAELAEIHATWDAVLEERCAGDELHCTCVPYLRMEIARKDAALKQAREALDAANADAKALADELWLE